MIIIILCSIDSSNVNSQLPFIRVPTYGHCRLLLPWLRVSCWLFCYLGLRNCWHGCGLNPEPEISWFSVSFLWPLSHSNTNIRLEILFLRHRIDHLNQPFTFSSLFQWFPNTIFLSKSILNIWVLNTKRGHFCCNWYLIQGTFFKPLPGGHLSSWVIK